MTTLPIPESALAHHIAILGKTGSGKTSTEKLVVEHAVAAGFRVCVLDTLKSDWWGITSSATGKSAGLPFSVLGGPRGHVPLHSSAGKAIGQLVGSGKLPLSIVDMADFEPGGVQRFFVDFAQALWKSARGVVYLVIEEAHEIAPKERAGFGAENFAIHWAKKLATGGRTKGIRLVVATQSVQQLHNRVLGSCETMIAHRLTTPADQNPVLDWLRANAGKEAVDSVASSLASLPNGTGWVCSGEASFFDKVAFPKFRTFDNTKTPAGDAAAVDVKTAPVDQEELRGIIGEAVKEAEANDPKALKGEIARLKKALADLERRSTVEHVTDPKEIETAEARGWDAGIAAAFEALAPAANELRASIDQSVNAIRKLAEVSQGKLTKAVNGPSHQGNSSRIVTGLREAVRHAQGASEAASVRNVLVRQPQPSPPPRPISGSGNGHLPPGERAVLIAAAQFGSVAREQLTVLTGYKRSSRDAYIQRLREKGFIEVDGQVVRPTDAGLSALPADYEPLPTGADLRQYWLARLPEGERRVLECLIANYPDSVQRNDIDEATGYKRSSRDAYLQRMKAKRLWEPDGSAVRASAELF